MLAAWIYKEASDIESTRLQREAAKTAIHNGLNSHASVRMLASSLNSRCGIPVYTIKVQKDETATYVLHYNLETRQAIDDEWLVKCLRKD